MMSGLLLMAISFSILFTAMFNEQVEAERAKASEQVNQLLQAALENAMLKRDLDGLRGIVSSLGLQDRIVSARILNTKGEVRFASDPGELGVIEQDIGNETTPRSLFINTSADTEILRSINPVHNKPECFSCHGNSATNPINGVLVVDYDARMIIANARSTTMALMLAGAAVVFITLAGGWWFMHSQIRNPINNLVKAQHQFREGDLNSRVDSTQQDEFGDLALSFNRMAGEIAENINETQRREVFLQSLIDGIPDGVRVIDRQYRIVCANQAYLRQQQRPIEETINTFCYRSSFGLDEPCPPTMTICPMQKIMESGAPVNVIHYQKRKDGTPNGVEISAAPIYLNPEDGKPDYIVEVLRELSKTIDYSQEQRLSELGELAAGVAHEIYNPLGSIRIALKTLFQDPDQRSIDAEEVKSYLALVEEKIEKCIEVTNRLLKLSASPTATPQLLDLNPIVEETISLLKWEGVANDIQIRMNLVEPSPRIVAFDGEMRMAVLNVVQNAFHAMPEGGSLAIESEINQDKIALKFQDTGVGISKEKLRRIFEPFYSERADKPTGTGTGLGLPITKAILERANGAITASSKIGEGSLFTITLPAAGSIPTSSV